MGNVLPFSQFPESTPQADPEVAELLAIRDHVMTTSLAQATEAARLILPELNPQPAEQPAAQPYQFPYGAQEYPDARIA